MSRSDSTSGLPSLHRPRRWTQHLRWRREQLIAAGYDEFSAHRLAADGTVDVHTALIQKETSAEAGDTAIRRSEPCSTTIGRSRTR